MIRPAASSSCAAFIVIHMLGTHVGHVCICLQHCACTKVEPLATSLRVGAVCPLLITTDSIS